MKTLLFLVLGLYASLSVIGQTAPIGPNLAAGKYGLEGMAVLATVNVPNTGGGQNRQTVTIDNVVLGVGEQTLRVYAVTGSFNFNWMDFSLSSARLGNEPGCPSRCRSKHQGLS